MDNKKENKLKIKWKAPILDDKEQGLSSYTAVSCQLIIDANPDFVDHGASGFKLEQKFYTGTHRKGVVGSKAINHDNGEEGYAIFPLGRNGLPIISLDKED